jgi:hypothetical protein
MRDNNQQRTHTSYTKLKGQTETGLFVLVWYCYSTTHLLRLHIVRNQFCELSHDHCSYYSFILLRPQNLTTDYNDMAIKRHLSNKLCSTWMYSIVKGIELYYNVHSNMITCASSVVLMSRNTTTAPINNYDLWGSALTFLLSLDLTLICIKLYNSQSKRES